MSSIKTDLLRLLPPSPQAKSDQEGRSEHASDVKLAENGSKGEFRSLVVEARNVDRASASAPSGGGQRELQSRRLEAEDLAGRQRLERASREFEAVFMRYLATAMRETVSQGASASVKGAQFYEGLIDEQLGRLLADSGRGLRLAESLKHQIVPAKENNDESP